MDSTYAICLFSDQFRQMESTSRSYSAVNNYKLSPISSFLIIFEEMVAESFT